MNGSAWVRMRFSRMQSICFFKPEASWWQKCSKKDTGPSVFLLGVSRMSDFRLTLSDFSGNTSLASRCLYSYTIDTGAGLVW